MGVLQQGEQFGLHILTWCTSRSNMRTLSTRPSCNSTRAVMAMSLMMQKPEPQSEKAWWVPPAVLQASL